ncbi:hypothetical protein HZH66_003964 [Vespula vulgaris]|uniref:Uncharacterized protein n=1 Tax=Vespula vulgaris TaxID=7454 RepID=A0A834KE25_VESVU|nr:hypothetical protein HZH66_003964 [Vespula vulgaris]
MVERRETSRVRHFKGGFGKGHEILIASSYRQTQTRCRNSSYSGRQLCTVPCAWLARCSRHYAIYHKDKSSNVERECHAYPDSRCSSLRSCLSRMNADVGDYVDDKSKEAGKPTEFPASSRPTMTLLGNLGKCGHVRHNHPDVSRHMVCARLSWGNRTTFHHRTSLCS